MEGFLELFDKCQNKIMSKLTCSCGRKTDSIRFVNGKAVCDQCKHENLSGKWIRRVNQDRQHYAKDILQPNNPHYEEVYGNKEHTN